MMGNEDASGSKPVAHTIASTGKTQVCGGLSSTPTAAPAAGAERDDDTGEAEAEAEADDPDIESAATSAGCCSTSPDGVTPTNVSVTTSTLSCASA